MTRRRAVLIAMLLVLVGALVAAGWPERHALRKTLSREQSSMSAGGKALQSWALARATSTAIPVKVVGPKRPSLPYLVLFVLDGARPSYFNVPGIPHIKALMRRGTSYSNAFAGILESETPSGHASIGTGSNPNRNGILAFDWAKSDNTTIDLFDPTKVRNGDMERVLGNSHAPSIASLVHATDRNAKVVALGGHKYYASDAIGGPDADVIMYYSGTPTGTFAPMFIPGHGPPSSVVKTPGLTARTTRLPVGMEDHLAMRLANATFNRMHQKVTLINVPEFDWPLGHVNGASRDPAMVRSLMQGFDQDLASLEDTYRKAGVLNKTLFVITADHGFAPVYHTVSDVSIKKAVAKTGAKIISDTYHTGAFLWLNKQSVAARAAANIAKLRSPYIQSVYYRTGGITRSYYTRVSSARLFRSAGVEAANQYLLGSFNGPNGPDVVVLFTENSGSEPGGQAQWKGDHGGAAWKSQHLPLVIAGPGVKPGVASRFPARLIDIAPTLLRLMGITPAGMQGIALADALRWPTASQLAQQQSVGRSLQPVVTALQAESSREVAARR